MNYTYNKSPVSLDRLTLEIQQSTITIALDNITLLGIEFTVSFKGELDQSQIDILNALVAAHSGEPLPENVISEVKVVETDSSPITIIPTAPKNEYCMEPWGSVKQSLQPSLITAEITLSNKSQDGLTFDYTCSKELGVGNYVFQNEFSNRSWIMSFTATTVTFDFPQLDNGTGLYSVGVYCDQKVPDWKPLMYLWGLFFNAKNQGNDDFVELSILDKDDLFKSDEICMALFGVIASEAAPYIEGMGFEDNGEYGHWTKYYDEQWVLNCAGREIRSPDGSPGELLPGLYLRMSYFSTLTAETKTHFYVDYSPTSK